MTAVGTGGSTSPLGQVRSKIGDRTFHIVVLVAGYLLLALLVGIAVFLVVKAVPALHQDHANFLTSFAWSPDDSPARFGVGVLAYGTVVSSLIALVIAVPVALGVALFIAFYAPRRLAAPLGYLVDLLAAVPSVVYGLWGLFFLVDYSRDLQAWIARYFGWTHVLDTSTSLGKSFFVAGVVLAVMILPIVAAISREIFLQVPQTQREAALALGATRWEMIRWSALPYARSGIASAIVLGFGRALGETIAVALVLSSNYQLVTRLFTPGGNTIAANIANQFGDAGKVGVGALIASGLVLFVITLVVNLVARTIAHQSTPAGSVV
ncbi:MAG TPA: phosphate ABC transporter permease subunit PstC [Mycobacteriales bacterium]